MSGKEFELYGLEIFGEHEKLYIKYKIKVDEEYINEKKMLRYENEEDTKLLKSIEKFIRVNGTSL